MGNRIGASHKYQDIEPMFVSPEDMILKVWVNSCTGLSGQRSRDRNGLADPYIKLSLNVEVDPNAMPEGTLFGPFQQQETSRTFRTLDPKWEVPELFMFWVPAGTELRKARVIVEIMDFDRLSADDEMGKTFIKLEAEELVGVTHPVSMSLPVFDPVDNSTVHGSTVNVDVQLAPRNKSFEERTDCMIEFQRWRPIRGWGSTPQPGHFIVNDPCKYMTLDGRVTSQEFAEVEAALPIRAGYEVSEEWYFMSRQGDNQGWQYAVNFDHRSWRNAMEKRSCVRRRFWVRKTILRDPSGLDVQPPELEAGTKSWFEEHDLRDAMAGEDGPGEGGPGPIDGGAEEQA